MLDVQTGSVATKVVIIVEKDRIVSVGKTVPADAIVINLSDEFVMPGMVDCHAHILGNLKDFTPGSTLRISSAKATLWGLRNLQVWLEHGFTTLGLPRVISVTDPPNTRSVAVMHRLGMVLDHYADLEYEGETFRAVIHAITADRWRSRADRPVCTCSTGPG